MKIETDMQTVLADITACIRYTYGDAFLFTELPRLDPDLKSLLSNNDIPDFDTIQRMLNYGLSKDFLKEKYHGEKKELNAKLLELYRKHKNKTRTYRGFRKAIKRAIFEFGMAQYWQKYKQVYVVDEQIFHQINKSERMLVTTPVLKDIYERHNGFYVYVKGYMPTLHGFFVYLDYLHNQLVPDIVTQEIDYDGDDFQISSSFGEMYDLSDDTLHDIRELLYFQTCPGIKHHKRKDGFNSNDFAFALISYLNQCKPDLKTVTKNDLTVTYAPYTNGIDGIDLTQNYDPAQTPIKQVVVNNVTSGSQAEPPVRKIIRPVTRPNKNPEIKPKILRG